MPNTSTQVEALLSKLGNEPGATPAQAASLGAIINSSPALVAQVNAAAAAGDLKGFELLPAGIHAGGEYHPGTRRIRLPSRLLSAPPGSAAIEAELAFVLGHELQHGANRLATKAANEALFKDLEAEARTPSAMHDYTSAIAKRLAQNRRDEASAEIAGWNALVGRLRSTASTVTLKDIYQANPGRMSDFIDKTNSHPAAFVLKPNLAMNADMSISPTTANIEAMGVNYFDKVAKAFGGPVGIGHLGNSDYANYYGASAVSAAAQIDTRDARPYQGAPPRMVVDMRRLGLSESLLEENGLAIGKGNPSPKAYYDSSQAPATLHHFDQTWQTHAHVPVAPAGGAAARPRSPDDPGHPDHALLEQIRSGIRGLDDRAGRDYDDASERISRCLLAQCRCREPSLERVDHVVLGVDGRNVFAVQGRLDDPAHDRAHVAVEQAMRTPVEQSDALLQASSQQAVQSQPLQPSQAQAQQRTGPSLAL